MFKQDASVTFAIDLVLFIAYAVKHGIKVTTATAAAAVDANTDEPREQFAHKLLKQLKRGGIVLRTQGKGTRLARSPNEITVRDIVQHCGGTTTELPEYFGKAGEQYNRAREAVLSCKLSTLARRADWRVDSD